MKKPRKQIYRQFQTKGEQFLRKVRETEQVPPEDIIAGWNRIQQQIAPRQSFFRRNISYLYAAACICLLLTAGGLLYLLHDSSSSSDLLSNTQETASEMVYNDIVLITDNQTFELENDVTLEYDSKGRLNAKNQSRSSLQEKEKPVNNTLIVPDGKRAFIILSDGTKMHINSGSRVQYPSRFTGESRKISVEGEVFLSVVKNEHLPFLVQTEEIEIKVLGTQFNVCAYKDEKISSVVLVEGAVEVYADSAEKKLLQPNQRLEFSNGTMDIQQVDPYEYICWKDNIMSLTNRTVGEILDRLARYYKRTILYDTGIKNIRITGKLDIQDNLEECIEIICIYSNTNYTVNENKEIIVTLK